MGKRKLSDLIMAMGIYDALDERDKAQLADYIRSKASRGVKGGSGGPKKVASKRAATAPRIAASDGNSVDDAVGSVGNGVGS